MTNIGGYMLYCKYCNRECKNNSSLAQHEIRCKLNPNKILINTSGKNNGMYGKSPWNKGLTKETDNRILKSSQTLSKNTKNKPKKPLSKDHKDHISATMKEKNLVSNFKHRRKNNYYKGINFMSSYEVELAKNLDIHNIKWILPKRFKYYVNNDIKDKYHYYTPDFYLPDYNIYLDPKNDFLINNINPKLGYKDIDKIN